MKEIKQQIAVRLNIPLSSIGRFIKKENRTIYFEIEDHLNMPGIEKKVYVFILYSAYLNQKTDTIRKGSICRAGSMLKESQLVKGTK